MVTFTSAQQLSTLLRISSALDIVGDVTATVDNPSALVAWAYAMPEPIICAWRAEDSGNRYVQVSAACHRAPVHGQVTAVLLADDHRPFWSALLPQDDLAAGEEHLLPLSALATAWSTSAVEPNATNNKPVIPRPVVAAEADSRDAP